MSSPFDVVRQFESELCAYTGAPFAVAVTSCTAALLLAVAWHLKPRYSSTHGEGHTIGIGGHEERVTLPSNIVEIPKRTYLSVPMSIIHAGGRPTFRDEMWHGQYQLRPLPVWDAARWFTSGMYACETLDHKGQMQCVSFHHTKTLGLANHGGAILLDDAEAAAWLRRARFDGRIEGIAPKDQKNWIIGWHCYQTPAVAAEGLQRLAVLPKHNEPLPWGPGTDSDYPDLSQMEIFR